MARNQKIDAASDYAKIVQMASTGLGAVLTGAALFADRQTRKKEMAARAEKAQQDKKQVVNMPPSKAYEA